ncbi:hypothetical protein TrVFT333_002112 [Trichoderma virens FT-333]|nr:hypothetical protein TrVFT333_002112 [Trichoderma virens FT-333]
MFIPFHKRRAVEVSRYGLNISHSNGNNPAGPGQVAGVLEAWVVHLPVCTRKIELDGASIPGRVTANKAIAFFKNTWLPGGRRKGHFVILGPSASSPAQTMTSTPETKAEIQLILIPLREGWLPYPLVEIREVVNAEGDGGQATAQGCEVDLRNLGETGAA